MKNETIVIMRNKYAKTTKINRAEERYLIVEISNANQLLCNKYPIHMKLWDPGSNNNNNNKIRLGKEKKQEKEKGKEKNKEKKIS